jgi:hypothetical protein
VRGIPHEFHIGGRGGSGVVDVDGHLLDVSLLRKATDTPVHHDSSLREPDTL